MTFFLGTTNIPYSKEVKLKNQSSVLILSEDLKSIKSYANYSKQQFISGKGDSLYQIFFGGDYQSSRKITAYDAVSCKLIRRDNNVVEIEYQHPENKLRVICSIRTDKNDLLHYWNIRVEKQSRDILTLIKYPIIACKPELGEEINPDALVFPLHEGVLLKGLHKKGAGIKSRYPGKLSSQMMYNFDRSGGLFYAALDGEGYAKNIGVQNNGTSVLMAQELILPIQPENSISQPYEVATGLFGGKWEDGAAVYRRWSDKQIWAKKKILQRNIPKWLKKPNLFVNISVSKHVASVTQTHHLINKYHSFFNVPIVTTVFGWEKNGTWIGPDYFPPRPDRKFYEKLGEKLRKNGDHLHFYTSGFRWGVRKPIKIPKSGPKVYSKFNGKNSFDKYGKHLAVLKSNGELSMQSRSYAENYLICIGHNDAATILERCYDNIYEMGVTGIDLDQNLGGGSKDCFHPSHTHPKGGGIWQTHAMEKFIENISKKNKKRERKCFHGVEEPCERFAHLFDIYHGRSFTDSNWPVYGPDAVSLPLYIFLNHEYQLGYAGWIDRGFSPFGSIKHGLGRAFIFGLLPGIRVNGSTEMTVPISDELLMLKSYMELMKKMSQYALYGRMIGEASVTNVYPCENSIVKNKRIPIQWLSVQGIVWQASNEDKRCILLANMSDEKQSFRIRVNELRGRKFNQIGSNQGNINNSVIIERVGDFVSTELKPWELAGIMEK